MALLWAPVHKLFTESTSEMGRSCLNAKQSTGQTATRVHYGELSQWKRSVAKNLLAWGELESVPLIVS